MTNLSLKKFSQTNVWRDIFVYIRMMKAVQYLQAQNYHLSTRKRATISNGSDLFLRYIYNLNRDENGRIPVEEVANRVNCTLEQYPVNEERSEKKYPVKRSANWLLAHNC